MKHIETETPMNRSFRLQHRLVGAVALMVAIGFGVGSVPSIALAEDFPQVINGQAITKHPAYKPIIEAAALLKAGKLGDVRKSSVKEVRDEWAAMSAAERQDETTRNTERAPDPKAFAADIAKIGILTIYGESATLRIPTPDDDTSAMVFVALEDGRWRVTGGPMTFEPPPVETAPAIVGAAILEHPIGVLAVDFAKRLEKGDTKSAVELLSKAALAKRATLPAAERAKSDTFLRQYLPKASLFSDQIRSGGTLSFFGDKASLSVMSSESTKNADGSTTFSSTSTGLGFELEDGKWRINNE